MTFLNFNFLSGCSHFDNKVHQVSLMMFSLNMVEGTLPRCSYSLILFGTPPSCLKVSGGLVVFVGGLQDFSASPSPLGTNWAFELIGTWFGFGLGVFGTKGLGSGLDNYNVAVLHKLHIVFFERKLYHC